MNELTKDQIGYVYILLDKTRMMVKIGKSMNPHKRLKTLIYTSGLSNTEQFISKKIIGYSELEKKLHEYFASDFIKNEWFKCSYQEAILKLNEFSPSEITSEQENNAIKNSKEISNRVHTGVMNVMNKMFEREAKDISGEEYYKNIIKSINDACSRVEGSLKVAEHLTSKYSQFDIVRNKREQAVRLLQESSELMSDSVSFYKKAIIELGSREKIQELINFLEEGHQEVVREFNEGSK